MTRWAAADKIAAVRTPGGHRRYLRSEVLAIVSGLHPDRRDHDPDRDAGQVPIRGNNQDPVMVPSPRNGPTLSVAAEVDPERQAAAAAVVAEALAVALEAAGAEAAEAVLVTAAAVTEAARRAADAAESAREARAFAAAAAAQSVALEAERTAARVRERAALAAALLTDEQWDRCVDRRANFGEHEFATPVRDAAAAARVQEIEEILTAAATRDSRAEIRDRVADERERAASRPSFLGDQEDEEYEQRAAAMDRIDALADRASAASDRATLSARPSPGSGAWGFSGAARVSEVAAELSHDLRVPLSSIIASVEMLEDELSGHPDENIAALLGRAMRAGDRMVRMLDQNMTPRAAGNSLALPEVDLAEVVRQLVLALADVLEPVGAVVETGVLPVIRADSDGMYSVLQNLVTNSVKFARPGVPARVRISARRSVDGWRISVRDNGMGLPERSGLDVFSLFSRGTTAFTGHGIGLATVARIVAEHGGRVGATPVETGAQIWFELPEDEVLR